MKSEWQKLASLAQKLCTLWFQFFGAVFASKGYPFEGIHHCPIKIIKGLTDKGHFQYLTKLKGPQVGNYLYTTQFLSLK